MKNFTEDEKIIARNIDKRYKWMARDSDGGLCIYKEKPKKSGIIWNIRSGALFDKIETLDGFSYMFLAIKWEDDEPTRISDIYGPHILDDAEREYLGTVLKPFHDDVKYVVKHRDANAHFDENTHDQEFLFISLEGGIFVFPDFDAGKMYSGMELGKRYKLDELGITYKDGENE